MSTGASTGASMVAEVRVQPIQVLSDVQLVAFGSLAVVSLLEWRRRRGEAAGWVALTFGTVGAILVIGKLLPKDATGAPTQLWPSKILLAWIMLFPYFLYRFMAALKPPQAWLKWAAPTFTGLVAAASLALPYFPKEGAPRPGWFQLYVLGLVLQWTVLAVAVAVGLWRAGAGEPTIARRRMRVLASGSAGLALIIVIAGATPGGRQVALTIVTQLMGLGAAALFYLGFAPPTLLRQAWRQHEDEALRLAGNDVATAATGEAALAQLKTCRPEVLVLDLGLPGMGGKEVLRLIRQDPALRLLPVVVVSAHAAPPTISEMTTLGCNRYLTKPFDPRELVRAVGALPEAC